MHDARWFEAAGLPACALVSSGFIPQARYQAKILDASTVPQVFVPHPISDQTTEQMHQKADVSFEEVYNAITMPWSPMPDGAEATSGSVVGGGGGDGEVCNT
jgi:hypothetical protein